MRSPIIYFWPQTETPRAAQSDRICQAFERRQEGVFHLFGGRPRSEPPGSPIRGQIKELSDITTVEDCRQMLEYSMGECPVVVLFVQHRDGREDPVCGFVVDREGHAVEAEVFELPGEAALYSRSKGLLEGEVLSDKGVLIVGLGSFGSLIAVEFAKAGIGRFCLIDFDRVEAANIARHACGLHDLGRFKTLAVRDLILHKNPYAMVRTHEIDINQELSVLRDEVSQCDLIIAATDENRSRLNLNQAALAARKTAIFGRAITRAAGGDVFRLRPFEGPCLNCVFGSGLLSDTEEISNLHQAEREAPAYVDRESLAATVQVGLSSDIIPITNFMVKMALLEISRGLPSGLGTLDEDLKADFYIWANRREESYDSWPPMEFYFNRNSILRWYGAKVERDPRCLVCGD